MSEKLSETEAVKRAMKRASETARIRAARFDSKLAVWRDGKVVLLDPTIDEAKADVSRSVSS